LGSTPEAGRPIGLSLADNQVIKKQNCKKRFINEPIRELQANQTISVQYASNDYGRGAASMVDLAHFQDRPAFACVPTRRIMEQPLELHMLAKLS
jgi:hypothetical protein